MWMATLEIVDQGEDKGKYVPRLSPSVQLPTKAESFRAGNMILRDEPYG